MTRVVSDYVEARVCVSVRDNAHRALSLKPTKCCLQLQLATARSDTYRPILSFPLPPPLLTSSLTTFRTAIAARQPPVVAREG